nr:hypothetical protein IUWQDXFC_IUWQDXFC_CDS_0009 [Microvirus sp.]
MSHPFDEENPFSLHTEFLEKAQIENSRLSSEIITLTAERDKYYNALRFLLKSSLDNKTIRFITKVLNIKDNEENKQTVIFRFESSKDD